MNNFISYAYKGTVGDGLAPSSQMEGFLLHEGNRVPKDLAGHSTIKWHDALIVINAS